MLNRRNFMSLLGLSPTAMLLKPDRSIPMGKNIQGKSVDMVIIDEMPSKWVDPNPWRTTALDKVLKDMYAPRLKAYAFENQSMDEMLYEFHRLAPRSCCKIKM